MPSKFNIPNIQEPIDICILKCYIPDPATFSIAPYKLNFSARPATTVHDGFYVGYGMYGTNGEPPRENDGKRRLGNTYMVEHRNANKRLCRLTATLPAASLQCDTKPGSHDAFTFSPGTLTLNLDKAQEMNVLDKIQENSFPPKSSFTKVEADFWIQKFLTAEEGPLLFHPVHPKQSLVQKGDSGSPFLVDTEEGTSIFGVMTQLCPSVSTVGYFSMYATPIGPYKSWILDVLRGDISLETFSIFYTLENKLIFRSAYTSFFYGGSFVRIYWDIGELFIVGEKKKTLSADFQKMLLMEGGEPVTAFTEVLLLAENNLCSGSSESQVVKTREYTISSYGVLSNFYATLDRAIEPDILGRKFEAAFNQFLWELPLYSEHEIVFAFESFYFKFRILENLGLQNESLQRKVKYFLSSLHSMQLQSYWVKKMME